MVRKNKPADLVLNAPPNKRRKGDDHPDSGAFAPQVTFAQYAATPPVTPTKATFPGSLMSIPSTPTSPTFPGSLFSTPTSPTFPGSLFSTPSSATFPGSPWSSPLSTPASSVFPGSPLTARFQSVKLTSEDCVEPQVFRFLDLPAEIRIMIYPYMLTWPEFTKIPHHPKCPAKKKRIVIGAKMPNCQEVPMWPPYRKLASNILLVNRQIYNEARYELLKSPFLLEEAPPFVYQKALPAPANRPLKYLTSNISPSLLCGIRFMKLSMNAHLTVLTDNHSLDDLHLWEPWNVFLEFLWRVFYNTPPALQELHLVVGGLVSTGVGAELNGAAQFIPRPGHRHPREATLYYLAGVLRMLSKKCTVKIQGANVQVIRYLATNAQRPKDLPAFPYPNDEPTTV